MKNVKIILLTLSLFIMPVIGMEVPSQRSEVTEALPQNMATLVGLPTDVKGHIYCMLISEDIIEAERALLVLAATNKQLLKNPHLMISILNGVLQKDRLTSHAIELAERLHTRTRTFLDITRLSISQWLKDTKQQLKPVPEFEWAVIQYAALAGSEYLNLNTVLEKRLETITNFSKVKNLDLNRSDPSGTTYLMLAAQLPYPGLLKLLISLGANLNSWDKTGNTALSFALKNNCRENAQLIQQAIDGAQQKLSFKKKNQVCFYGP